MYLQLNSRIVRFSYTRHNEFAIAGSSEFVSGPTANPEKRAIGISRTSAGVNVIAVRISDYVFVRPGCVEVLYQLFDVLKFFAGCYENKFTIAYFHKDAIHTLRPLGWRLTMLTDSVCDIEHSSLTTATL